VSAPERFPPPGRSPPSERFPKALRLRTRREFLRVQDRGQKVAVGPLLALALPRGGGARAEGSAPAPRGLETRLGITVSSKVGNAVLRVRIRRRLRELFRKRRGQLPAGLDLVLIARGSAREADYEALSRAFDGVSERLRRLFP
jgi:ribonuclease P protein component